MQEFFLRIFVLDDFVFLIYVDSQVYYRLWVNENVLGSIILFDGFYNSYDGDDDGDNNKINIKFIECYFFGNDLMEFYK